MIPILMVNAKNSLALIISASLALANHASCIHGFSSSRKTRSPDFFGRFIVACHGAVFTINRWRMTEHFAAMSARGFNRPSTRHGFVIAFSAAIFGLIASAGDMRKFSPADGTITCNLDSASKRQAATATIQGSRFSIFRDVECRIAMLAFFMYPLGDFYAAH